MPRCYDCSILSLLLTFAFALSACSNNPSPQNPLLTRSEATLSPLEVEVRACLERHFQNNLGTNVFLSGHFIEGDFNGDGSQDLAVDGLTTTLTPGTENTVLPNCTFVDLRPMIESQPGQKSLPNKDRPAVVGVIHGEGPIGWRSQNAKDTHWFWVHPVNSIEAQSSVRVFNFIESARSLKLKGDVVRLGMLSGQAGFAYYNGTSYEWHPVPNTTSP